MTGPASRVGLKTLDASPLVSTTLLCPRRSRAGYAECPRYWQRSCPRHRQSVGAVWPHTGNGLGLSATSFSPCPRTIHVRLARAITCSWTVRGHGLNEVAGQSEAIACMRPDRAHGLSVAVTGALPIARTFRVSGATSSRHKSVVDTRGEASRVFSPTRDAGPVISGSL